MNWQPIETAPTDGARLLLWDAKRDLAVSGFWHVQPSSDTFDGYDPGWEGWATDDEVIIWDGDADDGPTHWMPPPEPPKAGV